MRVQGHPAPDGEGLGDIGREIASDAVRLVRAEVELAKAEVAQTIRAVRNALIALAVALLMLLLTTIFAFGALAEGVGSKLFGVAWVAWGILAAVFLVTALVFAWSGYRNVHRTIAGSQDAVGSIREDVAWLKLLTRRSAKGS